jgi:DNA-binding beta-propeller fold protein YncE
MNALLRIALALPVAIVLDAAAADAPPVMELALTIPMPGVTGRIDHIAADAEGHRLFVAALGNGTLEMIDTRQGRHYHGMSGFDEPQGIAFYSTANYAFIANGKAGRVDVLNAASFAIVVRIGGLDDADNIRLDASARAVVVGYGAGALAFIDARQGVLGKQTVPLPGHPESFQLEQDGPRAFVNVPSAHKVVVVDRINRTPLAAWDVPDAAGNYPMALDERGRRLFVGARQPAVMLVYDIDSGKVVARVPIGGDADDMFYDPVRRRIYVICGEGHVDVIRQEGPDRYTPEAPIATAPHARTGMFVPDESNLYVAAPAEGDTPARILVFRLR